MIPPFFESRGPICQECLHVHSTALCGTPDCILVQIDAQMKRESMITEDPFGGSDALHV
jgi:hypothetical protein